MDFREKLGNLDFPEGGVFCNFGFGLREKLGNLDFPGGGVFCNFGIGLREKLGNLDFPEGRGILQLWIWTLGKNLEIWIFQGGVFCNFGFGLREKVWKFGCLCVWGGGVFCKCDGKRKKTKIISRSCFLPKAEDNLST